MALQRQNLAINFSNGIDTKSDPWQLAIGKFASLKNVNFNTPGLIAKSNGFAQITSLPSGASATTLTSFNGGLVALGQSLYSFSTASQQWLNKGRYQPAQLSVLPVVRGATNQSNVDLATASTGASCIVFLDGDGSYKYRVVDSITGQELVAITALPTGANAPRVSILTNRFIITYLITVVSTPHLQYIAIPLYNLSSPSSATDLSTTVRSTSASGYDVIVTNNTLYVSWDASDSGGAVRTTFLTQNLTQGSVVAVVTIGASLISLSVDSSSGIPTIWVCFLDGTTLKAFAYNSNLVLVRNLVSLATSVTCTQLTSTAQVGAMTFFYQNTNVYSYSSTRTDFISSGSIVQSSGTVTLGGVMLRSVGLASKAALIGTVSYMLVAYGGVYQPSYFLVDGAGNVIAKLAYENGGGYITSQVLPQLNPNGTKLQAGYLLADLITSVNRTINATQVAGIYSQTGANQATFDLSPQQAATAEIGGALHMAGGFLWMYDGSRPVEHNFHLWPDDLAVTTATSGGSLAAQQYFYQATYEWTDASGNIHRSAPSIPISITTTGSASANTVNVPTLRLTYKTADKVRICLYRWSAAQQSFYQVTSVSSPTLNDTTSDSVAIVDTLADASIIGNALIYTTGGVVENIAYPAVAALTLYRSRLFVLGAEDRNLLWYSKQVIEATPVEPSDLFTYFVPPTTGAQGSTGALSCLAPMDDKLIMYKANSIYFMSGQGPDNLGANSDYSDPLFITSTVGSASAQSIVLTPLGLLFDSSKGKWLLGRDLSTSYIGADVEAFNGIVVTSAVSVPATNQLRVTLSTGDMLQYDYYVKQWNTPNNIQAISSTLFQNTHTYLTIAGGVFQETPGMYTIGSTPVLMSLTTGWLNLGGLQGFERAYALFLLAKYITPHTIAVSFAYDYNPSPSQTVIISPDNYSGPFGSDPAYGQSQTFGGMSNVEQWEVYLKRQKCQAVQITVQEVYDPSLGVAPGAGFTLSGLNLEIGIKGRSPKIPDVRSVG